MKGWQVAFAFWGRFKPLKGGFYFGADWARGVGGCFGFGGLGRWPFLGGFKALRVLGAGLLGFGGIGRWPFLGGLKALRVQGANQKKDGRVKTDGSALHA